MQRIRFDIEDFEEFMYVLNDFYNSLTEWSKRSKSNTWDVECYIKETGYTIYLIIDESTNKSK